MANRRARRAAHRRGPETFTLVDRAGTAVTSQGIVQFPCYACGKPVQVHAELATGDPFALHEEPRCTTYEREDRVLFVRACRLALVPPS